MDRPLPILNESWDKISSPITEVAAHHGKETDTSSVARLNQDATFISVDDCSVPFSSDMMTSFHFVTSYVRRLRQGTYWCKKKR